MEEVFKQIRRGGITIMPDYTEYTYESDGIFVSHLSPSKLLIVEGEVMEEQHPHRDDGCCQFFYDRRFDEEEYPDGYLNHDHFIECYMRMVRNPVSDYLRHYWLTNTVPKARIDPWTLWYCDRCEGPDNMPEVERYKCLVCKDIDICIKCYTEVDSTCPKCYQRITWMGQSEWQRREILIIFRLNHM
jgi:hypothetical protein